jgi:hypothetical protein
MVPEGGAYAKLPATPPDVASSWTPLRGVPYVIVAGVAHVSVGVALLTTMVAVTWGAAK